MHASTQDKSLVMRSEQNLTLDSMILEVVSNLNDSMTWKHGVFFLHLYPFNPIKDTTSTYELLTATSVSEFKQGISSCMIYLYVSIYENSVIESQKNKDRLSHPFQLHY